MDIASNFNISFLIFLFANFKHMCLITFYDYSNPYLNALQLMVSEVIMFHKNTELLSFGDSYDLYLGNNGPTERITMFLVGMTIINQLFWVKLAKKYCEWSTNTLYFFFT